MDNKILQNKIDKIRRTYRMFGFEMDELETYLEQELEHKFVKSGEAKDYYEAYDKLEELFKFVITAAEGRLERLS